MVMGKNNKDSIAETKDNNSIDSFSEVLINENLIADAEAKYDMATIGMQFNSIDFLAESLIHSNSFIIEEEENDMAAKITK